MLMLTFTATLWDWAIQTCEGDLRSKSKLNILSASLAVFVCVCVHDVYLLLSQSDTCCYISQAEAESNFAVQPHAIFFT